jgi:lysophospholipid acyltransferase (LPLAT)-like uncharacterized protein
VDDPPTLEKYKTQGKGVYAFWHNQLVCAGYFFRNLGIVVLVSRHFDGEYIARIIEKLGFHTARGSSTRGGIQGLLELARWLDQDTIVAFTADGPRGPRYKAKPGPVLLARKSGIPVVCFHIEPKSYWELPSWDGLRIPKPFTKAFVKFGRPLWISENESNEVSLARLQDEMEYLQKDCKSRWD